MLIVDDDMALKHMILGGCVTKKQRQSITYGCTLGGSIFDTCRCGSVGEGSTLIMCIIWAIWKERNNCLFEGKSCTVHELQDKIKLDIRLWIDAGAARLGCLRQE
ncbi:hypothetical protein PVAP13_6NG358466 [Panicum virgatum]|uniref:Uncharacterized protein n=1 Tax=Panicum virgatum TaxID=38727 RepID=A0A8T0R631_PANVG|nr:hypothetical protein PVAP13_6NG358466 [Panicum virgatum]